MLSLNAGDGMMSRYGWCGVHSCNGVGLRSCGAIIGYGFISVHGDKDSSSARRAKSRARSFAFWRMARKREYWLRQMKRCSWRPVVARNDSTSSSRLPCWVREELTNWRVLETRWLSFKVCDGRILSPSLARAIVSGVSWSLSQGSVFLFALPFAFLVSFVVFTPNSDESVCPSETKLGKRTTFSFS